MRAALVIIGILLFVAGVFVTAGEASYKSRNDVLKVGGVGVSVTQSHQVPVWAGGIAIGLGGILIIAGIKRR